MTDQTLNDDRLAQLRAQVSESGTERGADDKSAARNAHRQWKAYYSDAQLAARFLAKHKDMRFISEYARWTLYSSDTGVWKQGTEFDVRGLIQDFLKGEYNEAKTTNNVARLDEAEVCQRSFTPKRILDWITPDVAVSTRDFNRHKDLIVVSNGVVDLRTGELKDFDPELLFDKRIPYPYVAGARNKYTDAAIASLPEDTHRQFQIMTGQALTGHQPSRSTIFFLWGNGANGKSTILDLMSATAGDYGRKPKKDVLLKGGSNSNFHTIAFKGARQALIEELPDERFLDGGVVRDLAGTTTMTGEHKGKDLEEFEMEATIFITLNDRPQVTETAHGVWRRLRLISFPYRYVETQAEVRDGNDRLQDPMLKDLHKKSEKAVIAFLAWRIEGARLWYENRQQDPADSPTVEHETKVWRNINDALAHWWEENLVADPDFFILTDDLLDDFNTWRNMPKATWGKHNLVDKFSTHSVFRESGLEYKQAARHKGLTQSKWTRPNAAEWQLPREAKTQATFIKGVRFRSSMDDVVAPDDASELTDDLDLDLMDDNELFDEEAS